MTSQKVVIIGAGFGGLSSAIRLATLGAEVTIIERQQHAGGKLQRIQLGGYTFDRGPSTITMPHIFREVFELAGVQMEDYVKLYDLEPRTRNVFADGTTVDLSKDRVLMKEQIAKYSPEDALHYEAFMKESEALYCEANQKFLGQLMLHPQDKYNLSMLKSLLRVRPLTKLDTLLQRYFRHPYTLAMFGRYATYVGSSPYEAPSIFAMLGHVEAELGVYGVEGGTYSLISGMEKLAREKGVVLRTGEEVKRIKTHLGKITGLETDQGEYSADVVIANGDVLSIHQLLIPEQERPSMNNRRLEQYEPSLSGFVTLAGIQRQYDKLHHHTVFFPKNYRAEFTDIFSKKRAPEDPTLYLCYSGYSEPDLAPDGASNLFILANAPYVSKAWRWEQELPAYQEKLIRRLSELGIPDLEQADVMSHYTPEDIQRDTLAYRGSIYGISSNTARQTFTRPSNCSKDIEGLWFVGGTTHPGGGTPIVTLSGRLVAEEIARLGRR
ncbi:phytoene desaturase family protein [Paenibacillus sp. Marseille-Q4541]|uniref:phytoene desaturase family protein n=1 Tax=Paenibacillus sp. Marseille-Q4541 TaxID=2831522 RepID=UPI001BA992F0|nr:phytoene desaturase family protein [Paenibacillus sp. Marseille-Q4541]